VGWARDPKVVLKPGDSYRVEIESLGVLMNPVIA
jgi:2-keto-4-pentenoate hydratase/2-oxohepta-3-ene-1,7-dioic acid hydratase in catechol pathway